MKLATDRPGIGGRVLEGEEQAQARALVGRQARARRGPSRVTSPPLIDVRRVAHQRVGEGRLARAVGAHDRVDLALADRRGRCPGGSRDPASAAGATRRPRMTSCGRWLGLVAHDAGHGSLAGSAGSGGSAVDRRRRSGTRSARVMRLEGAGDRVPDADPQHVDGAAWRDRRAWRAPGRPMAQIIGAIGPSRARRTSLIRIVVGRAAELVAAVRAARADDEAGVAEAHRRAARGRRAAGPPRPRSRPGWPARSRSAARAGP